MARALNDKGFYDSDFENTMTECRDLNYDSIYGNSYFKEKDYLKNEYKFKYLTKEEYEDKLKYVDDESDDTLKKIDVALNSIEFLSKKEKKVAKRIVLKRLETIKKTYKEELQCLFRGTSSWLNDLESEFEEELTTFKDAISNLLDIECSTDSVVKTYKSPKYEVSVKKDFSSDIPEIISNEIIKVKVDKESLEEFLCSSDGSLENIGMLTAENRDFKNISDVTFKITPIPDELKKRQRAYTEADGKAVAELLASKGITTCGWIHTHPFGKTSTFFSGTDVDNTKEMCVFPLDYSLAIVVGCKYTDPKSYLVDGHKVISECEIEWSLGSMIYKKDKKDSGGKIMKLSANAKDMSMIKYKTDIQIVNKEGKETEYKNLKKDDSLMETPKYETRTWYQSLTPGVQTQLDMIGEYNFD